MRAHAFRLTPGGDLKAELERLTKARGLRRLRTFRVGSPLPRASGCSAPLAMREIVTAFTEPMEIVSCWPATSFAPTACTSTSASRDATAPASAGISCRAAW